MSGALSMENSQDKKEIILTNFNNLKNTQNHTCTDSKHMQVVLNLTRQSPRLGRKAKKWGKEENVLWWTISTFLYSLGIIIYNFATLNTILTPKNATETLPFNFILTRLLVFLTSNISLSSSSFTSKMQDKKRS